MYDNNDQEIQEQLLALRNEGTDWTHYPEATSMELYNELFDVLETPPPVKRPSNFAHRLAVELLLQQEQQQQQRERWTIAALTISGVLSALGLIFFLGFQMDWGVFTIFEGKGLSLLFGAVVVLITFFFDRWFVAKTTYSTHF